MSEICHNEHDHCVRLAAIEKLLVSKGVTTEAELHFVILQEQEKLTPGEAE